MSPGRGSRSAGRGAGAAIAEQSLDVGHCPDQARFAAG
jgi:hypothetical protein